MPRRRTALLRLLLLVLLGTAACAPRPAAVPAPTPAERSPALPMDPAVVAGTLENGLRYLIHENDDPEARAELRLVVHAGSILEDEDQRGLAHFVEHMAFNGTRHFERQALVDYLERTGMRFGPDINAYTSFDETVYQLTVPTDSAGILATAFQILEDWAHGITFDPREIERERGVVIEEWRLRQGAGTRFLARELPVLLGGSRYPERLPIGTLARLQTFPPDALRRFYRDWYRPDLMAVVAVGDFDAGRVAALIEEHFGGLAVPDSARLRLRYPVPAHAAPRVAVNTDPEASGSVVELYFKHPVPPQGTEAAFRRELVTSLYTSLLTARLRDLARAPDAPFLNAYAYEDRLVRPQAAFTLRASTADNGLLEGLEALLTEVERVARHGFTAAELARQKAFFLRLVERSYEEREHLTSAGLAARYTGHLLTGAPALSPAQTYARYQRLLPTITLDEVNRLADDRLDPRDLVVLARVPEKESVTPPTEAALMAVFDTVQTKPVAPYEETLVDAPLLPEPPVPGTIVATETIAADTTGAPPITVWQLSNGARVLLQPTDFKDDEILFAAQSPGGTSMAPDSAYVAAVTAAALVQASGLGAFPRPALEKRLAGTAAGVQPWTEALQEGLSGSASPEDVAALFQLIYLHFTAPRFDSTTFVAYRDRMQGFYQNRGLSPEAAFADTLRVTLARHHPRARPWSPALFAEMDRDASARFYRDRFGDASDFTFFFVGRFEPDTLRPLVERYLASLPAAGRDETWRDVGPTPPEGVVRRVVRRGQEPKARTQIVFTGPMPWTRADRYGFSVLASVLQLRLREALREELGGTYSVGVGGSTSRYPEPAYRLTISFGSAPERLEALTEVVFQYVDSLQAGALDLTADLEKVRAMQRRSFETSREENRFWLGLLQRADFHGSDLHDLPGRLDSYPALLDELDAAVVRDAARRYLNTDRYVQVSLVPEGFAGPVPR